MRRICDKSSKLSAVIEKSTENCRDPQKILPCHVLVGVHFIHQQRADRRPFIQLRSDLLPLSDGDGADQQTVKEQKSCNLKTAGEQHRESN
jgi:hypothetical protein